MQRAGRGRGEKPGFRCWCSATYSVLPLNCESLKNHTCVYKLYLRMPQQHDCSEHQLRERGNGAEGTEVLSDFFPLHFFDSNQGAA